LKRPVGDLLEHLRKRQSEHGAITFAFKSVLSNGKIIPASYPKAASFAMSNKIEGQDVLRTSTPPQSPRDGASDDHSDGDRDLVKEKSLEGIPRASEPLSPAPSIAPLRAESVLATSTPSIPTPAIPPATFVFPTEQPASANLALASTSASNGSNGPPFWSAANIQQPYIPPAFLDTPFGTNHTVVKTAPMLPPAPPQSWESYTPPGTGQLQADANSQRLLYTPGSGQIPQFYFVSTPQGWLQQPFPPSYTSPDGLCFPFSQSQVPAWPPIPNPLGPAAPVPLAPGPTTNPPIDPLIDPTLVRISVPFPQNVGPKPVTNPPEVASVETHQPDSYVQAGQLHLNQSATNLLKKRKRANTTTLEPLELAPLGKRKPVPRKADEHFPAASEDDIRQVSSLHRNRR